MRAARGYDLRTCDIADEGLAHAVETAVDPVVIVKVLVMVPLGRVIEVEPAAGIALIAREVRAGREEAGDESNVCRTQLRRSRLD